MHAGCMGLCISYPNPYPLTLDGTVGPTITMCGLLLSLNQGLGVRFAWARV